MRSAPHTANHSQEPATTLSSSAVIRKQEPVHDSPRLIPLTISETEYTERRCFATSLNRSASACLQCPRYVPKLSSRGTDWNAAEQTAISRVSATDLIPTVLR